MMQFFCIGHSGDANGVSLGVLDAITIEVSGSSAFVLLPAIGSSRPEIHCFIPYLPVQTVG